MSAAVILAKLFPRSPSRRRRLIWRWREERHQRRQQRQQRHRRTPGSGAFALVFRIAPSSLVFTGPATVRADLAPLGLLRASTASPTSPSTPLAPPASHLRAVAR
jgi:hypothetical protein